MSKIIGIDPDLKKSGVAMIIDGKYTKIESLKLWDLFKFISMNKQGTYYLEYSTSNNTWHKGGRGAAINVGKNKAVSELIRQYIEYVGASIHLVEPKGYSNQFKNPQLFAKLTKWTGKTNADARAAAAIIYNHFKLK